MILREFNYEYLTVQFLRGDKIPDSLTLSEKNIRIECKLAEKKTKQGACYKILDTDLVQDPSFKETLKSWMYDYRIQLGEVNDYQRKVKNVLNEYAAFDELGIFIESLTGSGFLVIT